jgi:hypothetical protein
MGKWVAERYTEAFQKKSGGKTMAQKKYKGVATTPPLGQRRVKGISPDTLTVGLYYLLNFVMTSASQKD